MTIVFIVVWVSLILIGALCGPKSRTMTYVKDGIKVHDTVTKEEHAQWINSGWEPKVRVPEGWLMPPSKYIKASVIREENADE
jgi:hypothetical protein